MRNFYRPFLIRGIYFEPPSLLGVNDVPAPYSVNFSRNFIKNSLDFTCIFGVSGTIWNL